MKNRNHNGGGAMRRDSSDREAMGAEGSTSGGMGMPSGPTGMGGRSSGPAGRSTGGGGGMGGMGGPARAEQPQRRECATMEVHRRLLRDDPGYRAARSAIENITLERLYQPSARRLAGVAKIPVVVHVVYNTPEQNISEEQILSQIDVLNRDFRATNPDVSTVPAAFSSLISDPRVEFFLATTDPAGNPTNGITRTATKVSRFSARRDDVKFSTTGGVDSWPAERYLNVWVCPLDRVLGYAQFPGGPAATDGVVIQHSCFGTTGTAAPPFHLGRTATHEIGHFLNLYHIWGDDQGDFGNECSGTDEVADTPNQKGPNFGVPRFPSISCHNGPNGDLFMNYMDYVDDPVMVMFTHGQAARMEACLDTVRSSLPTAGERVAGAAPVPAGPIVSWGPNRIDAFVISTDHAMYHKAWDGTAWVPSESDYEFLGGLCISGPEVASWGPDRLDVFVTSSDSALYHKAWDGSAWKPSITDWEKLGGVCIGRPKAVAWGPNRLDVFVTSSDSALYHKAWDGSAWKPSITDWEKLGGLCTSAPEAVSWGPDRLDVFVLGPDLAVYHKAWDGKSWKPSISDFERLGGICTSAPKAVSWGPDRLDLFVLGPDHAVYHKAWDGNAWKPSMDGWERLGGLCLSAPEAVAWGPNRLDLFVLGPDHALYHKAWDGSAWKPSMDDWEFLGGSFVGQPRVTSWSPNRLDVFVTGTDSALYHKAWNGTSWSPSTTGFENLGGVISEFRLDISELIMAGTAGAESPLDGRQPIGAGR
jgi:hypothetical protein